MEYLIIIVLILLSAVFSGLTLGFFSLNKDDIERKAELGDKKAKKIYRVRKNGNLLLCTLLIGNVAVNSTLSIFLGGIASGLMAGIMATALIVVFGEITPQAVFSRHALILGSKFVWLVKIFIFILYPICKPMSWVLDKVLGDEMSTIYSKKELVKMIEAHQDSARSDVDADEEKIMKGALSFSNKKVKDIMTSKSVMIILKSDLKLTKKNIIGISATGHSRIPVYEDNRNNITAILYIKDLVHKDLKGKKVIDVARKKVNFIDPNEPLDSLFNKFKKTKHHLFVVLNKSKRVAGIVTIEDVIEEIIGDEIIDEYDAKK